MKKRVMAKILAVMMVLALVPVVFGGCTGPRASARNVWQSAFADGNTFTSANDVTRFRSYINHSVGTQTDFTAEARNAANEIIRPADDVNFMMSGRSGVSRFVNMNDGYAITLPTRDFDVQLQWSAVRTTLQNDSRVIAITQEFQDFYGNTPSGWDIVYAEWLARFIGYAPFLQSNALEYMRPVRSQDETILDGYSVSIYDIYITRNENILMPYYNIAIIRELENYVGYWLIVQKATHDVTDEFDAMIDSFRSFDAIGQGRNQQTQFEIQRPDYWDDATRAYFDKLMEQEYVDWGFFTNSMPSDDAYHFHREREGMRQNQAWLQNAMETTFTVMPTYVHIGFGSRRTGFPVLQGLEFGGGNGFNGRPVLHVSYQFTRSNNIHLYAYTPMFNILNGHYDDHFRDIAYQIKEYGYPVLFRLNNEMDTDWVSYAAIVSLLDPDIFVMTWERMYHIFREVGVTNAIWIFNPNSPSIPNDSRWGDWLNYLPAVETMHILGITAYEMGNNHNFRSFRAFYEEIYNRKSPYFGNWAWSISEFAAGSGGEARVTEWLPQRVWGFTESTRHASQQADWIEDMFRIFNDRDAEHNAWVRPIRIAIWFNTNDVEYIDGNRYIINHLHIGEHTPMAIEEFRIGLARTQPQR